MAREIAVGYDDSGRGRAALQWAAREAQWRDTNLVVCHMWDTPYASDGAAEQYAARGAACTLSEGALLAQQWLPQHRVGCLLIHGPIGPELVRQTMGAQLLVLGTRGLGSPARFRIGSATAYVTPRAHGPIAIVRDSELPTVHDARGVVVAAVDASALDSEALDMAFHEASWRDADLHIWCGSWNGTDDTISPSRFDEVISHWHAEFADVTVKPTYVEDRPLAQLLTPMDDVELVVLGAPTGAGAVALLNQAMLSQASCPVIVTKADSQ